MGAGLQQPSGQFPPCMQLWVNVTYGFNIWQGNITDFVSAFVCCRCEKVTFPFLSKDAVIVPDHLSSFTTVSRAPFVVPASIAACNASSPQQLLICFHILLVEIESFLSRNHQTVFLQFRPVHLKIWLQWSFTYFIVGVCSKNAYIGDVHFLASRLH